MSSPPPNTPGSSSTPAKNTQGQATTDVFVPMIANSAAKYGVPAWLLTGIFGIESGFGSSSTTSSAGAVGWMQFLPSTAARYRYPLTNTPTMAQAQAQFDAAAHYLSDLNKQYGSWGAAVQHYSGGGYNLATVQAKSGSTVQANEAVYAPIVPDPGVTSAADYLKGIVGDLTTASTWLKVLEVIGGIILLVFGLKALGSVASGSSSQPRPRTRVVVA